MSNLFRNKAVGDQVRAIQVREWARVLLGLGESVPMLVTELRRAGDDCPDAETVIAVLGGPGGKRTSKVQKPLALVTRDDLRAALSVSILVVLELALRRP